MSHLIAKPTSKSALSSLRARLFLLVLLVWLPALFLILYAATAQEQLIRKNTQAEALRLAQLAASYQEQAVQGTRELLSVLSQLPNVRQPNPAECRPFFRSLVEQYQSYTNLFVVDIEGNTYCTSLDTDPTPEAVRERSWFQRALEVRGFSQGDYALGLVTRRPVVTFSYPIFDGQELAYFVAASVDLAWVNSFIAEAALPPGVTIAAIDRNATILYVYPENAAAVGEQWFAPALTDTVLTESTGTMTAPGLDGRDYLFGFDPLVTTGSTYVLVGIPGENVVALRNELLLPNLLLLGAVGVLSLVIAWAGARQWFLNPLRVLASTARQVSAGDLSARVNTRPLETSMELRELGGVFNEMIGSLEANEAARTSEITQRRQSEIELMALRDTLEFQVQVRTAALERTEERLRLITDSLPVLISYIDAERRYRFNNRTYEDWFGYAPGQALGKTMPEVLGEAAYQALLPYVEQALSGQMAYFEMFTPYERGPRYIDGLYVPDMDEAGEVIGFYVLVMDITQRKRIEAQNTALFNITAAFSGALTVEQVAGVIVKQGLAAMGARTAALFLLTPDETQLELVSGSSLNAATRRESASVSLDNRMATTVVMRTQKPLWFENLDAYEEMFPGTSPVLRQHGLEAVAYLPLNSGGRMIGSIGVGFAEPRVFDEPFKNFITTLTGQCALAVERAQLYEAEAAARAAAEQASAARLKFLAMVSHELRTPLATIKGFSSTLLATDVVWDAAAQGRFIRLIDEEADHLTELIEQLLDLSRIQAGTLRIHLQTQSVEAILEAAQPRLTALAVRHELTVDVAPGLSPVLADRERIVQVVSNLVENAVKYSPPASPILVQITEEGGYVRFDVVDRGVGIPAEERDRVFEAFYQADRKEQPKGAGLGLAICKGLIEAHGGTIWLGEQDLGTRVSFTLPAQHAAVAVLAVPAASEDGAG